MNNSFEEKFEFAVLTKVQGMLRFFALKKIKMELKSNTASVYSELGREVNGYLELILSDLDYTNVSLIPYVKHCWSHGGCNHNSVNYKSRKKGHKGQEILCNILKSNTEYFNVFT